MISCPSIRKNVMRIDDLMIFTRNSDELDADGQVGNVVDFRGRAQEFVELAPNKLYINILVKTAAATSSGTGNFKVETGDGISSATIPLINTGALTLYTSRGYGLTALKVGDRFIIPIEYLKVKRYLAVKWDETATLTALKVAAFITLNPGWHYAHKDAQN